MKDNEEIIIKRRINIGNIFILTVLFIMSSACIYGCFTEISFALVFIGVCFGAFFVILFLYMTFKRPYYRINSKGVYANFSGYSKKEKFYSWERIVNNINKNIARSSFKNDLVQLDDKFKEKYINGIKKHPNLYEKYQRDWIAWGITPW